jgi:hypothetical protein
MFLKQIAAQRMSADVAGALQADMAETKKAGKSPGFFVC